MIICWLTQQWRSIRGDSSQTGFTARHRASCHSCKSLAAQEDRLIQRLRVEAARDLERPSPFLHGKIMAALDRQEQAQPARRQSSVWGFALAWAPAVLLCAAGLLWMRQPPTQNPTVRVSVNDTAMHDAVVASTKFVNAQLLLKLGEHVENPLRREMAYVVMDAKTAVSGIASRFLPENALAANTKY